jgi:hypothetical protein
VIISICVPSRGRPQNLDKLYESAMDTAANKPPIEFIIRLDNDDKLSLEAKCLSQNNVRTIIGPRVVLSSMWNEAAALAQSAIFFHCGDDVVFHTPGWDNIVLAAFQQFPDNIALVHGRDLVHDEKFGTHCFIHRTWAETVGYVVPPYFDSDMADLWLNDMANALNRRVYAPELITEHRHYCVGKAKIDKTHEERIERGERINVHRLYDALRPKLIEDTQKLASVIARYAAAHPPVMDGPNG